MQISANGIALEVEDHGSPAGEPLVLIMGLGMQLVAWHEDFVARLVARGFRVIRFDNRDIGLSRYFDEFGVPNLAAQGLRYTFGLGVKAPYRIADMAADVVALLDVLGIRTAHVCGASMGGMIVQHLCAHQAGRIKSATLMMTGSGSRRLPQPSLKVRAAMMSRPADARNFDSVVDHLLHIFRLIGSPGYPASEEYLRDRIGMAVRRAYHPQGVSRQLLAIMADGDRSAMLREIHRPVQIIHGRDDRLIPVAAGHDLHRRIEGSQLDVIEGMGHDVPEPLWPRFVADIEAAASRA